MDPKERIRQQVWANLRPAARPDSRFAWDFSAFIPDFEGSEQCVARICRLEIYQQAQVVFVAPDNCLAALRERCIADEKRLIIPTYGLKRGFLQMTRSDVPAGQETFAAQLDGLERFGRPFELAQASTQNGPQLLVTGASVVNTEGVRISNGPSYFELEWLMFFSLQLIQADTPIIAVVHDCQVVDFKYSPLPYSVSPDYIITPTALLPINTPFHRPQQDAWKHLPVQVFEEIQLLRSFYPQRSGRPAR